MGQPLAGIRVIEAATGVAGPFAGKLLADFGADVIKVEPPDGDPSRRFRLDPDDDGSGAGPLFLHLGTNKRSVVLDLAGSATDRAHFAALCAGADLLIESFPPGTLEAWGLGPGSLRAQKPQLVVCRVTPFGQDGPYAHLAAEEIVLYALAGPMSSTGVSEREPTKLAGQVVQYQCGNVAAMASLAAVLRAERDGAGATIDVANLQTQVGSIDRRVTYLLWYAWSGLRAPRAPSFAQNQLPVGVFPAADGYVQVFTIPTWAPHMAAALNDGELAARYADPGWLNDPDLPGDTEAAVFSWLADRPREKAMTDAQSHRWPVTAVNAPIDVLSDPHFAERAFFVEARAADGRSYRIPGPPWRMGDGWALRAPAPELGEHTGEVLAALERGPDRGAPFTPAVESAPRHIESTSNRRNVAGDKARLPLEGVRVVDLTVVWAGPYCTMLLADLGAEVIRVDNPWVFPTATRGGVPRPPKDSLVAMGPLGGSYPNLDPGDRPWNRHGMYAAHARGKLGVTLDLRRPLGRETFLRLVETADVLVENNSARVLDNLGIGWDVLSSRNPRLIAVRMAPLGLSGPYRGFIGFGAHFEALCGFTAVRGYPDADQTLNWPTFHMDPATGAAGAFAVMAALRRRETTGRGELIEFAQAENMMHHLGEYYVDASLRGETHRSPGNRHPIHAPQGCYPCAGDDRWAVISVTGDVEWAALAALIDRRNLSGLTLGERRARHDEIDRAIAAWTGPLDPRAVFERCQAVGVAAAPVLDEEGCYADPHLRACGAFRPNGSVDTGTWEFPSHLFRWDGPPLRWDPLCRLGADNEAVFRKVLGLDEDEYAALAADGHLSLDYLKPDGTPW